MVLCRHSSINIQSHRSRYHASYFCPNMIRQSHLSIISAPHRHYSIRVPVSNYNHQLLITFVFVAACNVTYIVSLDTESLTGPEAVRRCVSQAFDLLKQKQIIPVSVHFKVSAQGVTITDNTRKLFFRRHYPVNAVTFSGLDPIDRR